MACWASNSSAWRWRTAPCAAVVGSAETRCRWRSALAERMAGAGNWCCAGIDRGSARLAGWAASTLLERLPGMPRWALHGVLTCGEAQQARQVTVRGYPSCDLFYPRSGGLACVISSARSALMDLSRTANISTRQRPVSSGCPTAVDGTQFLTQAPTSARWRSTSLSATAKSSKRWSRPSSDIFPGTTPWRVRRAEAGLAEALPSKTELRPRIYSLFVSCGVLAVGGVQCGARDAIPMPSRAVIRHAAG